MSTKVWSAYSSVSPPPVAFGFDALFLIQNVKYCASPIRPPQ